ncbi:MAG: efflux RND transporter periplasmic adaptor subunit, partial [Methylococcaceae bacterium]
MTDSMIQSKESISEVLGLEGSNGRKPPWKNRWLWIIAAAIVVIGLIALFISRNNDSGQLQYETQKVVRDNLLVTVSATGTLAPVKEVDVGIEVSGTIKAVDADYNDRVEVGQVLARLDTTRLEAQALQSKAALKSAKAKVLQTQATVAETKAQMARLNHVRELSHGKVPSEFDLAAAKAALARAIADEASAMATVEQAQAALNVNLTDIS